MREKLVLIGAGSAMFTGALVTDVVKRGWECELGLVDTDPEALAVAEGLARKVVAAKRAPVSITASTDRREVLPGATVVVTTIAVGGRRAWEQDVFIPRKYGIYQPVGDSVMSGGTSRALRMIPPMVAIAQDVLDLAPFLVAADWRFFYPTDRPSAGWKPAVHAPLRQPNDRRLPSSAQGNGGTDGWALQRGLRHLLR